MFSECFALNCSHLTGQKIITWHVLAFLLKNAVAWDKGLNCTCPPVSSSVVLDDSQSYIAIPGQIRGVSTVRMISQHIINITTSRHCSLSILMRIHPKLPVPYRQNPENKGEKEIHSGIVKGEKDVSLPTGKQTLRNVNITKRGTTAIEAISNRSDLPFCGSLLRGLNTPPPRPTPPPPPVSGRGKGSFVI